MINTLVSSNRIPFYLYLFSTHYRARIHEIKREINNFLKRECTRKHVQENGARGRGERERENAQEWGGPREREKSTP